MPQKLDECVARVKSQIAAGKTKVKDGETAESTAFAICNSSLKKESAWLKHGDIFLHLDPDTFELTEATPPEDANVVEVVDSMPMAGAQLQPTEHEHPHMHGSFTHSHGHQHDKEHGIDGQMMKHEHPHEQEEKGEEKGEHAPPVQSPPQAPAEKPEPKKEEPKKEARSLVFGEWVSLQESVVDEAAKTVEVTLIKPGWSLNGRYYSKEVLAKAVPVFEGTKAYMNHPSTWEEKNRPERSVGDISGYYTSVRQSEDGSLKAVRHFVGKRGDEVFPLVAEAIKSKPDLIGLSINALGKTSVGEVEGRHGVIVEELAKSFSVDDVTTASAGGKYEKLMQSGDEMTTALLETLSYEEWRSARPDFEARIKKEMRTARKEELEADAVKEADALKEAASAKDTEIQRLTEQVKGLETQLADQVRESESRASLLAADLKLVESKLPADWCRTVRPQLLGKTPAEMDTVIETERKKFFSRPEPIAVQHAGVGNDSDPRDPAVVEVLEALKGDATVYPLEGESPAQYAARKRKLKGK